ncbi:MAG TPA: PQQ-binding-like beta-propeller repeat protein, partial [Planctomycetaceae bacterium]|nr:PQQ-binding-like beta-propeller repeat protein [Planctomycetaceae bacterium]
MPARVRIVFPLIALCALAFSPVVVRSPAHDAPQSRADAYPLGLTLRLLERDLTSKEYAEVLATMIPTDLEAEWRRIATADNYEVFLQQHGGKDKVLADPKLKAAYERRLKIAEGFLDLMRSAYKKRGVEPPFDKGEKIDLLAAGTAAGVKNAAAAVSLRAVMPAAGAERQWPRFRGPTGQGTALQADFPMSWSDTENVVWKSEVPGRGNGSPVIWDQKIFVTTASDDGTERLLLCFDRGSGELLWKQAAPKAAKQEKVYWKNSYASSTPATDGQRVIAFFGNSGLVCFDFSGQQLWHQDLGEFT